MQYMMIHPIRLASPRNLPLGYTIYHALQKVFIRRNLLSHQHHPNLMILLRGPISIAQPTAPGPPTPAQAAYPDYMNDNASPGWDSALAMASILDDLPNLPLALAGPLSQVLDVVSGMIDAVKAMREGKDGCRHLVFRVLKFLQALMDESRGSNVPIVEGTRTAARLFALKRNLMSIRDDALQWSRFNVLDSYVKRDKIKTGISRHGET
ncbi:hypothetical protein BS47DRAFT_867632 [Hydnum rufescens UP504]|uniref:Uncharacterized protein n=1 Tax=Hydnum rufescens UP504 TaxID=1448309 RepID=A0A9P6AZ15_9AGAM|nr:hypothetical protein BS47DRAFT_867632 [Hydnum rufescens UP504]